MAVKSILLCGVGGQGILLASDIISDVLMVNNFDVKKSEVHGMSQRGGAVVSTVRFGDKVYSPITGIGDVDYILAFERLEALRNLDKLKKDGIILVNDYRINPLPVATAVMEYPDNILETIKKTVPNVVTINAFDMAKGLGNIKVMNTIMIGRLAKTIDLPKEIWLQVIKRRAPAKAIDINIKAFEKAYNL
ncbi:indolepyruvate oxidoreductase subunit beta [candidate division WOR-3 bacterium]|nr:indolepyruvate oxidoreductase subunit beta [candidate division WOR-3 bacterium]